MGLVTCPGCRSTISDAAPCPRCGGRRAMAPRRVRLAAALRRGGLRLALVVAVVAAAVVAVALRACA
ncbi:MAG: hypothetical protein HY908_13895 [Myxococcales bacterium]|nr:hypothetical protein [Myxococcales bacterium]